MRLIDFTDGFTSASAPSSIGITAMSLESYASDAAFEAANGSGTVGDMYYNTADNRFRAYINAGWTEIANTELDVGIDSAKIADGTVSNTEFQYLNGVTSAIQTQLDGKQTLDATLTALAAYNTNGLLTQTASDTFAGRTLTGTTNEVDVSNGDGVSGNPTIGISDNPVIPGTDSIVIPSGTTAQRVSTTAGALRYNSDLSQFEGYSSGAWGSIGGSGSGGLDIAFSENHEINGVTNYTTGNNATFDNGGTLDGALSLDTTTEINGSQSAKYVMSSASTNDWIASEAITIGEKHQQNYIGLSFYYKYDGSDGDIEVVIFDDTNNAVLTLSTDTLNATTIATRYAVSAYVPDGVTSLKVGFHVATGNNTKILLWDDLEVSTNPFFYKNLNEYQVLEYTELQNTMQDLSAEFRFSTSLTTADFTGDQLLVVEDDSGNTRTKFVAQKECYVDVSFSFYGNAADTRPTIFVNGVATVDGSASYTAVTTCAASGKLKLAAGDYISLGTVTGTANNSATPIKIVIVANAIAEHVITPARSSLTDWAAYTPTTQGFGTISSSEFYWRRVGDSVEITGIFTTGTVTGDEAQVSLPNSYTVDTSKIGDVVPVGNSIRGTTTNTFYTPVATGGDAFINFTAASAGDNQTTIVAGSSMLGNTQVFAFNAKVPVTELDSKATFLGAIPVQSVAILSHVESAGTAGGTATSGSWQTRTLNTSAGDTSFVSLSSNEFTLGSGEYIIEVSAPAQGVDRHQARIYDVTGAASLQSGSSGYSSSSSVGGNTFSHINKRLSLTTSNTYRIEHQVGTTNTGDGYGVESNFGISEVYTQVKITKLK